MYTTPMPTPTSIHTPLPPTSTSSTLPSFISTPLTSGYTSNPTWSHQTESPLIGFTIDDEMDKQIQQHHNMLIQNEIVWNKTRDTQLDQPNNTSPMSEFCTDRIFRTYREDTHDVEGQPSTFISNSAFDNLPVPGDHAWHSLIDSYLENVDTMLAPSQQQGEGEGNGNGNRKDLLLELGQEENDQFDFLKDN